MNRCNELENWAFLSAGNLTANAEGVSSWDVDQSKLVSRQQAAVVSVQHTQVLHQALAVQPLQNVTCALPKVGGHMHSRLMDIENVILRI
jgi:hypothetical protein